MNLDKQDAATRVVSSKQIHDLKNRLTVVKGIAQLLARQVQRDDWQRDRIVNRVVTLQEEIDRMEEMVELLRGPVEVPDGETESAPASEQCSD